MSTTNTNTNTNTENTNSTLNEIVALKERFVKIKDETEELLTDAKKLSDVGVQEAKELIDTAKTNWHSFVEGVGGLNLASLFGGGASGAKKKVAAKVKKVAKSAKAAAKKPSKAKATKTKSKAVKKKK